ncbi:unnamed protein product [Linum trigynum]|uniref:Uncharacterized protein n=1 Tax=Linum trigynum TaxID=586398 RepID=A0AAV2DYM6_9ROSI
MPSSSETRSSTVARPLPPLRSSHLSFRHLRLRHLRSSTSPPSSPPPQTAIRPSPALLFPPIAAAAATRPS